MRHRLLVYAAIGLVLACAGIGTAGATYLFAPKVSGSYLAVNEPKFAVVKPSMAVEDPGEMSARHRASQMRNLTELRMEFRRIRASGATK